MPSFKIKYLSDGAEVFAYSTERDGTISVDAVFEVFGTEAELLEHVAAEHEKYLGFTHTEVEIFKVRITHVRTHKIGDKG